MADYREFERRTDPKHCGAGTTHKQHEWHESRIGWHLCTGNIGAPDHAGAAS